MSVSLKADAVSVGSSRLRLTREIISANFLKLNLQFLFAMCLVDYEEDDILTMLS